MAVDVADMVGMLGVELKMRKAEKMKRRKIKVPQMRSKILGQSVAKAKAAPKRRIRAKSKDFESAPESKAETKESKRAKSAPADALPKSKRQRKESDSKPDVEPNERKIKTMKKFINQIPDYETADFEAVKTSIKDAVSQVNQSWEHTTLTNYWTRSSCAVRENSSGTWKDCAYFSFDGKSPGSKTFKLVVAVAAAVRLVPHKD